MPSVGENGGGGEGVHFRVPWGRVHLPRLLPKPSPRRTQVRPAAREGTDYPFELLFFENRSPTSTSTHRRDMNGRYSLWRINHYQCLSLFGAFIHREYPMLL